MAARISFEAAEEGPDWLADRVMPMETNYYGPLSAKAESRLGTVEALTLPRLHLCDSAKIHNFIQQVDNEGKDTTHLFRS